jgi:LysM repeat protein
MIARAMAAKIARFVAPIALVAVAVGVYLIVHAGLAPHHKTLSSQSSSAILGTRTATRRHRPGPKFYVVKEGDTLSGISERTHVSILKLTTLNPNISPNALQTGQRLRLRR